MVELCTKIIEMRGMDMTGIYRVPGNKAAIAMLKDELDRGIDEVNADNEKWLDVNVISSLLKSFFRELPDPIVTDGKCCRGSQVYIILQDTYIIFPILLIEIVSTCISIYLIFLF